MLLFANSNQYPCNSGHSILRQIQKCKTSSDVNQVHARMMTTGLIRNARLTTKIVLSLSSSAHTQLVQFARYLFFTRHAFCVDEKEDDPFLWNAIIKTYSHGNDPKEAFFVLALMLENGMVVDKFSLSLVLKACSRVGLVREGMQVHGLMSKLQFGSHLFLQNCLVALYLRCRCLHLGLQVFDRMRCRDSVSYNLMIDGYVKSGRIDLARELFDFMPVEEKNLISWNSLISGYVQSEDSIDEAWDLFGKMAVRDLISWNSMINGFVKCGRMEDAQALFDRMPERDLVSWTNMIDGYSKVGKLHVAKSLFDEMPERDVVVCNAMMAGYVQNGCYTEALDIFNGMQRETNLSPDNATLLIALSAVAQSGHIDKGVAIHCYLVENGFALDGKLGVALIDMYSKCGNIENAKLVFEDVKGKYIDHWNAMIGGLAIHGLGELAFGLLMEMERRCVKPDDITFIGVLNACGHAGLVKEGMICFELIRRVHKVEPKLQHYGCMVDILGRAGQIETARRLIEEMPMEPNDVIWRTLLSACKTYECLELGQAVAEQLIKLNSSNPSPYVLLSNIFADYSMWDDVRRVRSVMRKRNLKKTPGCSRIVLDGIVHEFFVQDKSHPQIMEIYSL